MKKILHKKPFFVKNKTKNALEVIILANFSKMNSEKRISGRVISRKKSAVLGRIRFFDESYREGCVLCVRKKEELEAIDKDMLLLCPPLAIVLLDDEWDLSFEELDLPDVACLALDKVDFGRDFLKNKVALIDCGRGILIIDPSIDTLEAYSSSKNKKEAVEFSCASGKILQDFDIKSKLNKENYEYFLVSSSAFESDLLFDGAVDLWESACPELLIFDVSVPNNGDGGERIFCEKIENLFRAALYGSFALSISKFSCESELVFAMRLLHKTFCMLEAEGREFNGYLPKGITFSSPLWLMRPSPVTNPDFLILDLDTLLPSFFSLSFSEIIKKEKALKKELLSIFERYFANFAPHCDVFLKTQLFSNTSILRDLVRLGRVKVLFS